MPYKNKPKMGYKPKMQPPTGEFTFVGDPMKNFDEWKADKNKTKTRNIPSIDYSVVAESRIVGPSNSDTIPSQANKPLGISLPERPISEPTPKAKPATKSKPQPSKSVGKMKTISTPSVSGGGSKTVGVREIDTPSNFKTYDLNRLGQMSRKEFGQLKKQKKMSDKGYGGFNSMKDVRKTKKEMRTGERRARKLGS